MTGFIVPPDGGSGQPKAKASVASEHGGLLVKNAEKVSSLPRPGR